MIDCQLTIELKFIISPENVNILRQDSNHPPTNLSNSIPTEAEDNERIDILRTHKPESRQRDF